MVSGGVVLGLIISLIITFPIYQAFGLEIKFDQQKEGESVAKYIENHAGYLIINDTSTSDDPITADIISPDSTIQVNLWEIGETGIFKSLFINFTSANVPNENGLEPDSEPLITIPDTSTVPINVRYGVQTFSSIATVEKTRTSLLDNESSPTPDSFKRFNFPCPAAFGGDNEISLGQGDAICDNWEQEALDYTIVVDDPDDGLGPSSYQLADRTVCAGMNYSSNPLGDKVCPSPDIMDIFVEIDYMEGHYPNIEALENVVKSFQNAPEPYGPINLHLFIDEEISHVNQIPYQTAYPNFTTIKVAKFGTLNERDGMVVWPGKLAKAQVYYYYIWGHSQLEEPNSSGRSYQNGNLGLVTLGAFDGGVGNMDQQAGTFMHELGHNLNLNHGGEWSNTDNCKPNLFSVMSYSRQFSELLERPLDYSRELVGHMDGSNHDSLGMETDLVSIMSNEFVTGYPNCPFISTSEGNDQDFDGTADICDPDTHIASNTRFDKTVVFQGDVIIESGAVLTIGPIGELHFNSQEHSIIVRQGGGILIESGGKIVGHTNEDRNGNGEVDYYENLPMIFGVRGGSETANTNQGNIEWPEENDWHYIRHPSDSTGLYLCPPVDPQERPIGLNVVPEVELTSVNQWEELDLSHANQYWMGGVSASPDPVRTEGREISSTNTILDKPGKYTITINDGSDERGCDFQDNCFSPSYLAIGVGSTVIWDNENNERHTITSGWSTPSRPTGITIFDYGGELNNNIFFEGQKYIHTFEKPGTYVYSSVYHPWMKGKICVGEDCPLTDPDPPKILPDRFDTFGKWCMTLQDAQWQKEAWGLDIKGAPLCSNPKSGEQKEITMENVRAARTLKADKIETLINQLNDSDFKGGGKQDLLKELDHIREDIKNDKMTKVLDGYEKFKNKVMLQVSSETGQSILLKATQANIDTTVQTVPEFGTYSILILIISILSIIGVSRKIPFMVKTQM